MADRPSLNRLLSSWMLVAVVLSVLVIALGLRVGSTDGYRYLHSIHAGSRFAQPSQLLHGQKTAEGNGYDGQFCFYIAEDLLLQDPATERSLDNSLRYRRILYPALAALLAGGQRPLLPLALFWLNMACLCALAALGARLAHRNGASPWWALVLLLGPGGWLPAVTDLTEPLQTLLLLWGVVAESSLLLFLSGLAKETSVTAMFTETVRHALARHWPAAIRHFLLMGLLGAWGLGVSIFVHGRESTLGGHFLDPPGAPLLALAQTLHSPARFVLVLLGVLFCVLMTGRVICVRDRAQWAATAYGLVCLAAGIDTWIDPVAFLRVMAAGYALLFVSFCWRRDRLAGFTLMGWGGLGALMLLSFLAA